MLLLLVPLVAMQLTSEVSWSLGDFLAAAALLFAAGMAYTVVAQHIRTQKQRALAGLAVLAVLATVWAELAVGLFT
jgi:positive regulator of sigma E activity